MLKSGDQASLKLSLATILRPKACDFLATEAKDDGRKTMVSDLSVTILVARRFGMQHLQHHCDENCCLEFSARSPTSRQPIADWLWTLCDQPLWVVIKVVTNWSQAIASIVWLKLKILKTSTHWPTCPRFIHMPAEFIHPHLILDILSCTATAHATHHLRL